MAGSGISAEPSTTEQNTELSIPNDALTDVQQRRRLRKRNKRRKKRELFMSGDPASHADSSHPDTSPGGGPPAKKLKPYEYASDEELDRSDSSSDEDEAVPLPVPQNSSLTHTLNTLNTMNESMQSNGDAVPDGDLCVDGASGADGADAAECADGELSLNEVEMLLESSAGGGSTAGAMHLSGSVQSSKQPVQENSTECIKERYSLIGTQCLPSVSP